MQDDLARRGFSNDRVFRGLDIQDRQKLDVRVWGDLGRGLGRRGNALLPGQRPAVLGVERRTAVEGQTIAGTTTVPTPRLWTRSPTADCIVKKLRAIPSNSGLFNVIKEQFNVYVEVNGNQRHQRAQHDTDLGEFRSPLNLDDGRQPHQDQACRQGGAAARRETYDSDSFYYKVTETDFLVSNLGQTKRAAHVVLSV